MSDQDEFNRRRQQRSIVTAVLLVGMFLLFYFITLARIG
jgi:preprotein translocase subunit YajC